jgi:hypothetical protein
MAYIILGVILLVFLIGTGSAATSPNLKEVREKHEKSLFTIHGVTGVADDPTTQEIVVMVERPEHVKNIPEKLDGYRVKVEVTGKIQALKSEPDTDVFSDFQPLAWSNKYSGLAGVRYSRTGANRPVFGGISVGSAAIPTSAGTLGLVVSGTDQKSYVLSNAHVFAMDDSAKFVSVGTAIWQPGGYDGGTSTNRIGALYNYIPISFQTTPSTNYADAAIGSLNVDGKKGQVLDRDNTNFYSISGTTTVISRDTVRKSGRTTGVTTARVIYPSASVQVYYTNTKWAILNDQIITRAFSSPGDSGSAVDKGGHFVGLLYAGSNTVSVICKAQYILGPLGITV